MYRLPASILRFAILEAVRDRRTLDDILAALWREDQAEVTALYDALAIRDLGDEPGLVDGRHGLRAERMRELRRPLHWRPRRGLAIAELAGWAGVDRETMAAALERHGFLELVPYGGKQRRRLLTDTAVMAGYGHNVDAAHCRIGRLEGHNRANVFPVIYPGCARAVLWALDLDGIRTTAGQMEKKRQRLQWLLTHHAYLPNAFLAEVADCTIRAVEKARARRASESSVVSYRGEADGSAVGCSDVGVQAVAH
jgi:hypothetical protein